MTRSAIISIISAILLVIFTFQNAESTELTIFFWKFGMSQSLMLLIIFATGAGFGYFFHITKSRRKRREENAKNTSSTLPEIKYRDLLRD